jgi:DNA replication protein DnaC
MYSHLNSLKVSWIRDNLDYEVAEAARLNRSHHELIERLVNGEIAQRGSRRVDLLIRQARIPARKTLESFDFSRPKEINADLVRHLFSLSFIDNRANVVFIGTPGVGKTHLATALAIKACENRRKTLFISAAALINDLVHAKQSHGLSQNSFKPYLTPELLVIDELGYLPVDKFGAELLFQVLAGRYEKGSTVITTNRAYRDWNRTFADDNAMTAAVLDRVVHHCHTIPIIGIGRIADHP